MRNFSYFGEYLLEDEVNLVSSLPLNEDEDFFLEHLCYEDTEKLSLFSLLWKSGLNDSSVMKGCQLSKPYLLLPNFFILHDGLFHQVPQCVP